MSHRRFTTSFFAPPAMRRGDQVTLPTDEAKHARQVLRKQLGDEIVIVDGEGGWLRTRITAIDKTVVAGKVLEERRRVGEPAYNLTIGIGLLKQARRFEFFLEKAVELGVSRIIPLITERTEKTNLRFDRSEKRLVAAMKQCGRSHLIALDHPQGLDTTLEETRANAAYLCHETDEATFAAALMAEGTPHAITVLVGPEGGFSDSEIERARQAGFSVVSLGSRRLRTETAGLTAAATIMSAYELQD